MTVCVGVYMCEGVIIIILVLPPVACQIVPSKCLAQPMAMSLAVVRSWGEQAVFIIWQTSRCCMVYLMPQSQVSGSFEYPHLGTFNLHRPTYVRHRFSVFCICVNACFCSCFHVCDGSCMSTCLCACNNNFGLLFPSCDYDPSKRNSWFLCR